MTRSRQPQRGIAWQGAPWGDSVILTGSTGYTLAHADATQRLARGERQLFCLSCDCWRWADQCTHDNRLTAKEYTATIRHIVRETKRKYPSQEQRYRTELRKAAQPQRGGKR